MENEQCRIDNGQLRYLLVQMILKDCEADTVIVHFPLLIVNYCRERPG